MSVHLKFNFMAHCVEKMLYFITLNGFILFVLTKNAFI